LVVQRDGRQHRLRTLDLVAAEGIRHSGATAARWGGPDVRLGRRNARYYCGHLDRAAGLCGESVEVRRVSRSRLRVPDLVALQVVGDGLCTRREDEREGGDQRGWERPPCRCPGSSVWCRLPEGAVRPDSHRLPPVTALGDVAGVAFRADYARHGRRVNQDLRPNVGPASTIPREYVGCDPRKTATPP